MHPEQFCERILENLLKISTKRGINRSKAIKDEVASIKIYLGNMYLQTKMQESQILQFHGDTTIKLREIIDAQHATIAEKDREIKQLTRIRVTLNKSGTKLMKENNDLRKKYGEELPTFLEDTELN